MYGDLHFFPSCPLTYIHPIRRWVLWTQFNQLFSHFHCKSDPYFLWPTRARVSNPDWNFNMWKFQLSWKTVPPCSKLKLWLYADTCIWALFMTFMSYYSLWDSVVNLQRLTTPEWWTAFWGFFGCFPLCWPMFVPSALTHILKSSASLSGMQQCLKERLAWLPSLFPQTCSL